MIDSKKLNSIFKKFSQLNILVIGDVMLDSYLWGKVERISPEAPVPIVSINNKENRLGGAANVALNIKELGANVNICSVIGTDENGKIFKNLCKQNNINTEGLIEITERPTTTKTRVIGSNQHLLRIDDEITASINDKIISKINLSVKKIVTQKKVDAIIFEDYDKGTITPKIIDFVVNLASKLNIIVCVDPKKLNFKNYKNITLFKPNFRELKEGLKLDISKNEFDKLFNSCKKFQKENNIKELIVTLSESGIFTSNGSGFKTIPTNVRDVADVSGAGDTVISVATVCKASGLNYIDTAIISNIAGGLVCEKVGVVPINKKQLLNECLNYIKAKA